jgi:HSP20 family protein
VLDPFSSLREDLDRMFAGYLGRAPGLFRPMLQGGGAVSPSVDIHESDNEIVVTAEVPGMDEKDVEVSVHNGVLTIKGEKKSERESEEGGVRIQERSFGKVHRSFRLPEAVDEEGISAHLDKGLLTVKMRKTEPSAPTGRRIPIGGQS